MTAPNDRSTAQNEQPDDAADVAPATASDASDTAAASAAAPADGAGATQGAEVQRQLDEQRDRYLRLAAEYDNFRKRAARERQEAGTRAQAELVKLFIDAIDDIARFAHVDPSTVDSATVVQGVDMVEKKLLKGLGSAGLEIVDPTDQAFDPNLHEAVATEPALSREDDHMVARVYQRGFVFGGQLLRPARVVVKQWNG